MQMFEINSRLRTLAAEFDADTGEYPPEVADEIGTLNLEQNDRLRADLALIKELRIESAAFKEESKNLAKLAASREGQADWWERQMRNDLMLAGTKRFTCELGDCWVQKNPPSAIVLVTDVKTLPTEFQRVKTTIEPDKQKALEHYKAYGEAPIGFKIEQTESLRIK